MRKLVLLLLFIPFLVSHCGKPYNLAGELRQPLVPGAVRIGMIRYSPLAERDPHRPPPQTPIYQLQEELRGVLEDNELFTDVSLRAEDARYIVTGEIRQFGDASGNLNFPGFHHTGSATLIVHLELRDTEGTLLFAGDFRERVDSPYGVNRILYERIAQDFGKALEDQLEAYAGEY